MHSRDGAEWDRAADLAAVEAAYRRYASAGRYRLWAEDRPGYARLAAELRGRVLEALSASIGDAGARVLDVGCGSGDLFALATLADLPVEWTGVDLRTDAIAEASAAYPHARFLEASGDAIPLPDSSFDVAVAQVLFSSLPSRRLEEAVAVEIARLVRPGGWLVWLDIRYSNPSNPSVHGLSRGELGRLFPGWHAEVRAAGLLPPVARRLGRATAILYPGLSAVPVLRSHLVGRLQRPGVEP